ncbi:MAG: hydroxyacylglutathione hydrolase [Mariprofundaceae bacterium]
MWSYQHQQFIIHQLAALNDNYIYLIEARYSNLLMAIDPADASVVNQACKQLNKPLSHILNTHHHWDHTDGNLALKQHWNCQIIGAAQDAERIPGIDVMVSEQQALQLNDLNIQVLDLPGHTSGHIAYVLDDALLCGDTLFGAGCGRLFEGSPAQMWNSLQKLASLPDDTQVYCAHEYTLPNLRFARSVDPDNTELTQRIHQDTQTRMQKQPTIPSSMALEKSTNPFLRPLENIFIKQYAQQNNLPADALSVFTDLRARKNKW